MCKTMIQTFRCGHQGETSREECIRAGLCRNLGRCRVMTRELDFICDECFHQKRDEEVARRTAEDNCITEEKSSKCIEVNKKTEGER